MNSKRLLLIRENLELSQRQISSQLNVSKSTYARWETGEKIIPLKHLIDFCNLTNTTISYALNLTNKKEKLSKKISINKSRLGINLRKERLNNSITQSQLPTMLNTTQSVISEYENGITLIQTSFLYEFCLKYNIVTDDLFK